MCTIRHMYSNRTQFDSKHRSMWSQGRHTHILMTGGPSDFFGSEILAQSDFFGSMKDNGIFGVAKKKTDGFFGLWKKDKRSSDFLG